MSNDDFNWESEIEQFYRDNPLLAKEWKEEDAKFRKLQDDYEDWLWNNKNKCNCRHCRNNN